MSLPKKLSTNVRYLPSSAFNSYMTFIDPNAGQDIDGTPNPPTIVAQNIHANVAQWKGKETDKTDQRVGISSYKVIIHYPKTYSVNSGMQILLRNRTLNIESLSDPDMQQVELHLWVWEDNATS
jgi:SPP1 family predicted phage head-tail adaptor